MFSIQPCALPEGALLAIHQRNGSYTDCYTTEIAGSVAHAQYVTAFYTTPVFKLERWILRWAASKPSTDLQAQQLAAGVINSFSAWHVERRCDDQLLLCDFQGRTRSWLMVAYSANGEGPRTRLYFGSAVVAGKDAPSGRYALGCVFRLMLGFHRIYSMVLLRSARSRLEQQLR